MGYRARWGKAPGLCVYQLKVDGKELAIIFDLVAPELVYLLEPR